MIKDRISSALPPEDNVTRPKVESTSVHSPSTSSVFCRKKWPLLMITSILVVLMACLLPWPVHIVLTVPGAEVNWDGTVIESGEMVIDAWMYSYLLKPDELQIKTLQVPCQEAPRIVNAELSPLVHTNPKDSCSAVFTTWGSEGKAEWHPAQGKLYFTTDRCSWVVLLDDRVFVGSALEDDDYSAIIAGFPLENAE